jgi:hypothetical protein
MPEEITRGERCPADAIGAANKRATHRFKLGHGSLDLGQHQMRHGGSQLRRRVDQRIGDC